MTSSQRSQKLDTRSRNKDSTRSTSRTSINKSNGKDPWGESPSTPTGSFDPVLAPNSSTRSPKRNMPVEDQYRDQSDPGSCQKSLMDELDIARSSRIGILSNHRPSRSWSEHVDCSSKQGAVQILHAPSVPQDLGVYTLQSQAHLLRHYRDFVSSNIMPLGALHGFCTDAGEDESILNQSKSFSPVSLKNLVCIIRGPAPLFVPALPEA